MTILTSSEDVDADPPNQSLLKSSQDNDFQSLYDFLENFQKGDDQVIISIILPMFNEEMTIKNVIESLPNQKFIEVIVVNDKSTDGSLKEIENIKKNLNLKVVNHKLNKGYGSAILTGIKNAKGDVIVTMDSDGQHDPKDLLTLVRPIFTKEADYTIGSRYLGTFFYQLPVSTRLGELFVEKLIQIFFGKKIMNNQNGFRAFNRQILKIFDNVRYDGYAFCTEQILRASIEGYKIKECPIKLYDRKHGSSHVVLSKLAINMFSLFFTYLVKKIKLTVIRKDRYGMLKIYEKELKKSPELKDLRINRELIYINSNFFVEKRFT
ncbi:MAG: glycosyltransferase family 2 protein [Candidatus Lokiarchaeota archaeon]|nr:glycosyltransferase family 2 protein [Candidatus Lokiarchaeota archaeon]